MHGVSRALATYVYPMLCFTCVQGRPPRPQEPHWYSSTDPVLVQQQVQLRKLLLRHN